MHLNRNKTNDGNFCTHQHTDENACELDLYDHSRSQEGIYDGELFYFLTKPQYFIFIKSPEIHENPLNPLKPRKPLGYKYICSVFVTI